MTNFKKLSTAAAALALGTVMSTTAFAADDMMCSDFNAMSPDDQMAAARDWSAGREGLRDEARGDDPEVAAADENVSDNVEVEGGREEQRDMAMGSDEESDEEVVKMMADYCAGGDDLNLKDMRHPTEDLVEE